jgi:uncharacterized membrane protein
MQKTLALVVMGEISPLLINVAGLLVIVGVFMVAFLLSRRSTRAGGILTIPRRRRILYAGVAGVDFLIGLTNLLTGGGVLYVVLFAVLGILFLALAVRQKGQSP